MSYKKTSTEFQIDSIFLLEAVDENGQNIKRGTCFAVSENLLLTAKHTISGRNTFRCYLTSDSFKNKNFVTLELINHESSWDFAILRLPNKVLPSFIPLSDAEVPRLTAVKSCGYPVESGHIAAPIDVFVNNHYPQDRTHLYSFDLTQAKTVKDYQGMSGSPVLYKEHSIGVLVVQRGTTVLKVISNKDIAKEIPELFDELHFQNITKEEIEYNPPSQPKSPFYARIDCDKDTPNIKALDIGFDRSVWRVQNLIDLSSEWLIDYALSASVKKSLEDKPFSQMKVAMKFFMESDIHAMCDLFLHIAIRQNYKTIPIVNKIFNSDIGSALSCSHIVLNRGEIGIWLGISSIEDNLKDATHKAIENINAIFSQKDIEKRLILITEQMDTTWPFKDKLNKIADSTLPIFQRFDRLVIPVFITHDSKTIQNYSEEKFKDNLRIELDECRLLLKQNFSNDIIRLVDLKVFIFPANNTSTLFSKFKEGISLC
ncbi:Hachiman antiphage defense system protein HamA [Pseudoalteromonas sp. MMG012]|uniref:Hachiman antiphage defense system protein HamA n=1 Tax=Pseudoalteromonas sp. MMG012 TaxID=2822686 RepID=UPI001B3A526F|nr:Hachiman antiphage defense system protein HamA [Pseudoalteromonas sp. MMG012]MBQ4852149.1 DUF1837 domain-containing protein [Pseudoalteromonas sp. MMG012]